MKEMEEMEYFCKMIVAMVEVEEELNNETMTKDDNITVGFKCKNRKYTVVISVEEDLNE